MVWAFVLSLSMAAASVTGLVTDTTGGVVSGATVVVQSGGHERQTVTGPDGRFTVDDAPDGTTLVIRAGGFAEQKQTVR